MIDEPEDNAPTATAVETDGNSGDVNTDIIRAAYIGWVSGVEKAIQNGADPDYTDPETGLCALHLAVGTNDLDMTRLLVEQAGAAFFPDRFGRWPSLIAAECEVTEELTDYVAEQEARFLKEDRSS
jgi:ankyrin repeat protein